MTILTSYMYHAFRNLEDRVRIVILTGSQFATLNAQNTFLGQIKACILSITITHCLQNTEMFDNILISPLDVLHWLEELQQPQYHYCIQ